MTKEQEILDFLEAKMFKPINESSNYSERFKKATRGLRLRFKQRDAQGMIKYFWTNVADPSEKQANYGRMARNENFTAIEEIINEFRVRF